MKKYLFFILVSCLFSCSDKHSESGFELNGRLGNGSGAVVYLEQLTDAGAKPVDSVTADDNGAFVLYTKLPEPGFYNLKVSERSFATLILDSTQKVRVEGNAQDLGNTYRVSGSVDSEWFWELNETSKNNYSRRDSLQREFQTWLNSKNVTQEQVDSLDKVIGQHYDQLIENHNKYLVDFIDKHPGSFASLAAVQQLKEEEFPGSYKKIEKALGARYPGSVYVKLFLERSSNK